MQTNENSLRLVVDKSGKVVSSVEFHLLVSCWTTTAREKWSLLKKSTTLLGKGKRGSERERERRWCRREGFNFVAFDNGEKYQGKLFTTKLVLNRKRQKKSQIVKPNSANTFNYWMGKKEKTRRTTNSVLGTRKHREIAFSISFWFLYGETNLFDRSSEKFHSRGRRRRRKRFAFFSADNFFCLILCHLYESCTRQNSVVSLKKKFRVVFVGI